VNEKQPDLSIITVNWNTRELLLASVKSVRDTVKKHSWEFILVDNNSEDDSVSALRREFPEAQIIANDHNAGFSRANNQGLKLARGRHLLLLNPDTVCTEGALDAMVDFLDAHSEVGALGGQLLNQDGSNQRSVDVLPTPLGELTNKSLLKTLYPGKYSVGKNRGGEPVEVEQIIGAALMIRRQTLEEVGPLDERFFIFLEETDWAFRARQKGWKLFQLPSAKIYHLQGQSMNKRLALARIEYSRARYKYFRKHYGRGTEILLHAGFFLKLNLNLLGHLLLTVLTLGLSRRFRIKTFVYFKLWWWHLCGCPDNVGLGSKRKADKKTRKQITSLTTRSKEAYAALCLASFCAHKNLRDSLIQELLDHLFSILITENLAEWNATGVRLDLFLRGDPIPEKVCRNENHSIRKELEALINYVVEVGIVDIFAHVSSEPDRFLAKCIEVLKKNQVPIPEIPDELPVTSFPCQDEIKEEHNRWGGIITNELYLSLKNILNQTYENGR
jgi:GT2 family glycosyltransferase